MMSDPIEIARCIQDLKAQKASLEMQLGDVEHMLLLKEDELRKATENYLSRRSNHRV